MEAATPARKLFSLGDRVKMSAEGLRNWPKKAATRATVVGFGRGDAHWMYVRQDGTKTRQSYAAAFWEKAEESNSAS
jgi:hypothetical protein